MNVRQEMRERESAKKFWASLDNQARWEWWDARLEGSYDWRDWFHAKPSSAFTREVDQLVLYWFDSGDTAHG